MKPSLRTDLAGFGDRLEWAIEKYLGMTKGAFAEAVDTSPSQLSNWIARPDAPLEGTVQLLSEKLGVPPAWLRYGVVAESPVRDGPSVEEVGQRVADYIADPARFDALQWVPLLWREVLQAGFSENVTVALFAEISAGGRNQTAYGETMAAVQRGAVLAIEGNDAIGRTEVRKVAEQNAAARAEDVREITSARRDDGEEIPMEDAQERIARRLRQETGRATGTK